MRGAWLCLLLAAGAGALELPRGPREASLATLKTFLDHGLWNDRITALYALGDWGAEGLPLLAYASDDADWQVRLTVVHFLGKLGEPAAPALSRIIAEEPCRHVRLSALQGLRRAGPGGARAFAALASPEDERALAYLPESPGAMGKPAVIDAPGGGMTAAFFNGAEDFRACASSERSGRRARPLEDEPRPEAAAAPEPAPAPPPAAAGTRAELDALLAQRAPERLPSAPGLDPRPAAAPPAARVEPPARPEVRPSPLDSPLRLEPETLPAGGPGLDPRPGSAPGAVTRASGPERAGAPRGSVRPPLPGEKESLPSTAGLPPRAEPDAAVPSLVADAGAGRVEGDPVPALVEQLALKDPRRRARAADELGKRGAAALPAVPALRRALKDRDRRVRASAALALGNAGDPSVRGDLARALRDKDEDVRFSARVALDRLGLRR